MPLREKHRCLFTQAANEIERLRPYVEAFRREEARSDKMGGEVDKLRDQLSAPSQQPPMQADIAQIIDAGWKSGKSSADVAAEILREFDTPFYPTCAKCGCDTQGEAALIGDQIWCHPCADANHSPIEKTGGRQS
jgi:hypothetical protein